jgi:hypothetical protein
MALHYRGHDWGRTEFYFLRDSAQKELQRVPATCANRIPTIQLITLLQLGFHKQLSIIGENYL